ncbi:MAG TPA: HAMP domain-containing sensor histidine kinase [Candidatus Eisenbacteria bacterium]
MDSAARAGRPGSRKLLRGSLRHRLLISLAGLSALAVGSLACVYAITESVIERSALRNEMTEEIHYLIEWEHADRGAPPLSATLSYFPSESAPPDLRDLPPGTFKRLHRQDRTVQVLTAADERGRTHVLVQDLGHETEREKSLLLSLLAGVATAAAGAWWVSARLARHILSPLTELVGQIAEVDPLAPARRPVARTRDAELDPIPDAVNKLIGELDHVLSRERAFADAASHELRTPLAIIRGAVDLLRERGDSPAHIVDRLDRAARRAQEDLGALLSMSPSREPAAPHPVDLRVLLPAAADPYLREGNAGTRVVWEWGVSAEASLEPAALAIVFANLLRNALRAAPDGEVRIRADNDRIQIVDDGEGLPEGWPTYGEPRGRGLGLAIARILAERNGWQVRVEPGSRGGTEATLNFRAEGVSVG